MPLYKCERCHKIFKQKGHYNTHLARKNPCEIKIYIYECAFCDKAYKYKHHLNRHVSTCQYKVKIDNKLTKQLYEYEYITQEQKKEYGTLQKEHAIQQKEYDIQQKENVMQQKKQQKENNTLQQQIKELQKLVEKQTNKQTNEQTNEQTDKQIIHNNTYIDKQQIIVNCNPLRELGDENISYLTPAVLDHLLTKPGVAVEKLI
jgi:uncharacterized C2H2 Zn-finger protein